MTDQTVPAIPEVTDSDVYITRAFNAPRDVVWRFLTEPELLAQWFGPTSVTSTASTVEVELRPGGAGISTWSTTRPASTTRSASDAHRGHPARVPRGQRGRRRRRDELRGERSRLRDLVPRPRRQDPHDPAPGTLHRRVPRHDGRTAGRSRSSRSTRSSPAAPRERDGSGCVADRPSTPRRQTAPGSRSRRRHRPGARARRRRDVLPRVRLRPSASPRRCATLHGRHSTTGAVAARAANTLALRAPNARSRTCAP